MLNIETLTDPVYAVGESPVWRAAEGALYWVDIPAKRISRLGLESAAIQSWSCHAMVACIAFKRDGTLVAGMEDGIYSLTLAADGTAKGQQLATPAWPMRNMRFNDGRCDRQGRFWAGTMHMDMPAANAVGSLYRYSDSDGLAGPFERGLCTQNGLAWSPEGDVMYLSDSHPKVQRIWAYDYDTLLGTPGNRRVFVDMNQHPGRPDGAAVDEDGCYWTCANDAGLLLRFTPAGQLDRSITLPVKKPSMCAFGGHDLATLFVTSIRPQGIDLALEPLAGAVFALQPGVKGLLEPEFGAAH